MLHFCELFNRKSHLFTIDYFYLMKIFKQIFDFYLNSSIHVGMSCYALVRITQQLYEIPFDASMSYFAFFGTIVGYNFVKYDALARIHRRNMRNELKTIALLSFCALLAVGYFFLQLQRITQILSLAFLVLVIMYTLPFFPNKRNARNWAGIKIYMVSICWVGVTVFLPIINSEIPLMASVFQLAAQRFILIFVLILIFEIIDLKYDDPYLKTVPQQIGVLNTKKVGSFLLVLFVVLEFLDRSFTTSLFILKLGIAMSTMFFLLFANEQKSKYYSSFWVESIPIFWWVLFCAIG